MAPMSNSTDFTLTRDEIVYAAFRKNGIPTEDVVSNPPLMALGIEALELVVKGLQVYKIFLWATEWVTKTLAASSEVTGTDGNIYTCIRGHVGTASNTPVTGADYPSYWVRRGATGGVWSATTYISAADFDLEADTLTIEKLSYRNANSDNPIELVDKFNFLNTYDKTVTGTPVKAWLERKRDTPHLWLWPLPDRTDYILNYQRTRRLQDFDAGVNNGDFPVRWLEFLVYRLAERISPELNTPLPLHASLKNQADELFILARAGERESVDCEFISSAY